MKIEFHSNLGHAQTVDVSRVVVYDMHDNPVALAVEVELGVILAATAEHSDFNEMLKALGLSKTVIVHDTPQIALPQIRFPQSG